MRMATVTGVDVYESHNLLSFLQTDLFSDGIHACRDLAYRIIELQPVCARKSSTIPHAKSFLREAVGRDLFYAMQLEEKAKPQG